MLPFELDKTLDRISWGRRFSKVKDAVGESKVVVLKSLSLRDRNWINFIYEDSLKEAITNGVLTENELKKELELRYLWGPPQENELEAINQNISRVKEMLEDAKNIREQKRLEKTLDRYKERVWKLESERAEKLSTTAEKYAGLIRMYAIVFSMTYDENDARWWKTWNDFLSDPDYLFIANVVSEINKNKIAAEKDIRKIARSGIWRTLWNGGKNCGDLFGRPVIELDLEQQSLVYWSQVYDSVYEAYERPSDEIISDDEKLDNWFKDQLKKNKDKKSKKKETGPLNLSKKMMKHGEIFVVVDKNINAAAPSIEEVAKLNTPSTQKWKEQQFNTIKEKGLIEEQYLRPRGDRESRGAINSSDAVTKPRKTNRGVTRDIVQKFPGGTL